MSFKALSWALGAPVEKPSQRLVLIALANFADEANHECFPSVSKLSEMTLLDRKAIYRALAYLDEVGLIKVKKSNGRANVYVLTCAQMGTGKARARGDTQKEPVPKEAH